MKTFKSVSEFKKVLAIGDRLHAVNHTKLVGYDDNKKPIYGDFDMGIREVSIKQSNSFALKTVRSDGKVVDSWCSYPKASDCKIENNVLVIYEKDTRLFQGGAMSEGNPDYDNLPLMAVLTYTFV